MWLVVSIGIIQAVSLSQVSFGLMSMSSGLGSDDTQVDGSTVHPDGLLAEGDSHGLKLR